jgi:3'-5' exoribonuclease
MDDSEIEAVDYFPCTKRDIDAMWVELRALVAAFANPHLKALVESMLDDPEIAARYRRAPAAKQIHHAFLGGLLEHVMSVAGLAQAAASHYANIDRDLLLTGVILHDIGKIYELNYERGFSYSNDGQLLGHIYIGARMVEEKLRALPEFPGTLRSLVEHMILSHHGQLEYGSPKVPIFPEALLLHYLDDLDSKMECMRALIDNDRQVEGCFTSFHGALSRSALKKDRYLNGTPAVEPAPAAALSAPATETSASAEAPTVRPAPAAHPLFAPKTDSTFAVKLKQALLPAGPEQE